jgi:hypothetical protein
MVVRESVHLFQNISLDLVPIQYMRVSLVRIPYLYF